MAIPAKAKKLGHKVHVAGRGKGWTTYQCKMCWRAATKQGEEEFGPLIKQKCEHG